MLREHFMFYKDHELVRQVIGQKYFPYLNLTKQSYSSRLVVLDHIIKMDVDGENTAMNCLYFGALNSAAWLAHNIIGDMNQANLWYEKAKKIKQSVQKFMWLKNEKLFKDGLESSRITQQTQVYALKYGLVDENYKSSLVKFIEAQGKSFEQSFSYWLLNSMFSTHRISS